MSEPLIPATTTKRFHNNGPHSQLLQQLIINGTVDGMSAKEIREHYPQFQDFPLTNFRTNLTRYRNLMKDNNPGTQVVNSTVAQLPENTAGMIASRNTPNIAPPVNIPTPSVIPSATPTPRLLRFSETDDVFPTGQDDNELVPRNIEYNSEYEPTSQELKCWYNIVPWDYFLDNSTCINCLSVLIWLPSLANCNTVNCRVGMCQQTLIISVKLPSVLTMVDTTNSKFFKDCYGTPLYPSTHTRSVSQKKVLNNLVRDKIGEVRLTQVIDLPFEVHHEPVPCAPEYEAVQYKGLENGTIKVMVVELVSIAYSRYATKEQDVEIDHISTFGNTTVHNNPTVARSSFSYDPRTGRVKDVPGDINTGKKNYNLGSSGTGGIGIVARKKTPERDDSEDVSITSSDPSSSSDDSSSSEEVFRRRKKSKKDKRRKLLGKDRSSGTVATSGSKKSKKSVKSKKSTKSKHSTKSKNSTKSKISMKSAKSSGSKKPPVIQVGTLGIVGLNPNMKSVPSGTKITDEVKDDGLNCLLSAIEHDEDCVLQLQPIDEM